MHRLIGAGAGTIYLTSLLVFSSLVPKDLALFAKRWSMLSPELSMLAEALEANLDEYTKLTGSITISALGARAA